MENRVSYCKIPFLYILLLCFTFLSLPNFTFLCIFNIVLYCVRVYLYIHVSDYQRRRFFFSPTLKLDINKKNYKEKLWSLPSRFWPSLQNKMKMGGVDLYFWNLISLSHLVPEYLGILFSEKISLFFDNYVLIWMSLFFFHL